MEMIDFVRDNYQQALMAYIGMGKRSTLVTTLSRGPNGYNVPKLASELEKIGFKPAISQPIIPMINQPGPIIAESEKEPEQTPSAAADLPEVVQEWKKEIKKLLKEASFIHSTKLSDDTLPEEKMKEACFRIHNIYKYHVPALYKRIEDFEKTGSVPEEIKPSSENMSEMDLYMRIQTLKKNVSRDKKIRPHKVVEWEAELAIRKQELSNFKK